MASKDLALGSILLRGVPGHYCVEQVSALGQTSKLNIKHYSIRTEDDGSKTWIIQLNMEDAADLCHHVKKKSITVNDDTLYILFEWAKDSDIPEEWICKDDSIIDRNESTANVQPEKDRDTNKRSGQIKITGLPEVATEKEYLELYFEEKDNFNNEELHVESIYVDVTNRSAIVKFAEPRDAETVLKMRQLYIEEAVVMAEALTETDLVAFRTVEVRGPTDIVTEKNLNMLRMYFQNTHRSGGGKIVNSHVLNGVAYFTFETSEVSERVIAKDRHTLRDHVLDVRRPLSVPNEEDNTEHNYAVVISPILENVDEECIMQFFDQEIDGEILQVEAVKLKENKTSAVVVFRDKDSVNKILKTGLCMKEVKLNIKVYDPSSDNTSTRCTIAVTSNADVISKKNLRSLKMYFQNITRSGGGSIIYCSIKYGVAYIIFLEEEVARRVAERRSHFIWSQQINAALLLDDHDESCLKEPKPSAIQVSGLPTNVSEDYLTLYLENTSGIPVKSVKMGKHKESAIVEFEQSEGVDTLIQQGQLSVKETSVKVLPAKTGADILSTIEVKGKSDIKNDMDTLEQYFQSERRSGGGKIIDCFVDSAANVAYFAFENETVARRVAEREHTGRGLQVTLAYSAVEHRDVKSEMNLDIPEVLPETTKTVKVVDENPDILSSYFLSLYFENESKSGGGQIETIQSDDIDKHVTYVTFKDTNVAKTVAEKKHIVNEHNLLVSLYNQPPFYADKVLIRGLSPRTKKESLFNFLEAKTGTKALTMAIHTEEDDVVLVTMASEIDFDHLEMACQQRMLEGAELKVSRVPVSNCIKLDNLARNTTSDLVQFFFENKTNSEIEYVTMNETGSSCVVCFKEYKVIDGIFGQRYKIKDQEVSVKIYLNCIKGPDEDIEDRILNLPNPIEIKDIEPQRIYFCKSNDKLKNHIETELKKKYVDIVWPTNPEESILLRCILDENVPHCFNLASAWTSLAAQSFYDVMAEIEMTRISIQPNIWDKVKSYLKAINVPNPECAAIHLESSSDALVVVGQLPMVKDLVEEIQINIKRLEDVEKSESRKTKDVLKSLETVEIKLLKTQDVIGALEKQFSDLRVQIDEKKNDIYFEGPLRSVRSAKHQIEKVKNTLISSSSENISYMRATLYRSNETVQFVQEQLEANGLICVWDVQGTQLNICCTQDSDIKKCEQVILTSVYEGRIQYDRRSIPAFETGESEQQIKDIKRYFSGKVEIAICSDDSEVVICTTKDVETSVLQEVNAYISSNTIVSETVSAPKEIMILIDKYHKKEIFEISQKFQKYHIQIITMNNFEGFEVRGLETGIEAAVNALESILRSVIVKTISISKLGVTDHVTSAKGKDSIHTIESSFECIIRVEKNVSNAGADANSGILASCKISDDRKIYAWVGDMTDLEVDVIVTPQDEHLSLHGALGTAISSKGGHSVQQACEERIRNVGELREGEVFITDGGNMDVKYLVHMISPEWENGTKRECKRLIDSVYNCLLQADLKKRTKSVSIPAIGCGNNEFPVNISTSCIVQAVEAFFSDMRNSHITEIYLCDMKVNTVFSFAQSLGSVFGQRNVTLHKTDVLDESRSAEAAENINLNQKTKMPTYGVSQNTSYTYETPATYVTTTDEPLILDVQNKVLFGDLQVSLVCGEIANQQVDVIVNTTSPQLDLNNGKVSQSLLAIGGDELQQEVTAKYPYGIKSTQVAVTEGFKLSCKAVFHIALGDYCKGSAKELNKIIKVCLKEAKTRHYTSVAFPALGTGILGYPRDMVAREMFKAVSEYNNKYSNSSVKDVRFVIYHKDSRTTQAFQQESSSLGTGGSKTKKQQSSPGQQMQYLQSDSPANMLGTVMVSAKEGDLTTEDVDCIVNSTNLDLDFSTGAVSNALMQKCGKGLLEQVIAGKADMKRYHMIKTSAPGLPCKLILHIDGLTSNLQRTVEKSLKEADRIGMKSIAIPALGAGLKEFDVQSTVHDVLNGVKEFANSQPQSLKDVRFLILDMGVLEDYRNAIEEISDKISSPGVLGKIISGVKSGVKHVIGKFGAEADIYEQPLPQHLQQRPQKYPKGVSPEQPDVDTVIFVIFATKNVLIDQAMERLRECVEKEIHTKTFDDNIIKSFDRHQISEIQSMARQHRVHADIDTAKSVIKISGISENVYKASAKVQSLISDAIHMDLLSNIAQWYAIKKLNGTEKVVPYDKDVNLRLERSYKRGQKTVAFSNADGPVIVNFEVLEEFPEFDKTTRSKVIRRDLVTDIGSFACPASWGEMEDNLKVVELHMSDDEYKDIEMKFLSCSITVDDYEVTQIDRIQNRGLWEQYQSKKKQLEIKNQQGTTIERMLWHGTKATTVDSINAHGFNRSYCGQNATLYGAGVYFDTGCSYACGNIYSVPDDVGVKRVYYCRVLTGEYTKGDEQIRVLPKNPAGGRDCIFDSVVDNVVNPELFVIFHDSQAYPEYLISFKTNI